MKFDSYKKLRPSDFCNECGNGKNVPTYKLDFDKKTGIKKPEYVKDENGKIVTFSLYDKIQECKHVNDFKRFVDNVDVLDKKFVGGIDTTSFGSAAEVMAANSQINEFNRTNKTDLFKIINEVLVRYKNVDMNKTKTVSSQTENVGEKKTEVGAANEKKENGVEKK